MDIITRTLGRPQRLDVTTGALDADSAAIKAALRFDGAVARDSVSSPMPMPWGAGGGYTAEATVLPTAPMARAGAPGPPGRPDTVRASAV
ncbi:hypothetical protein [Streptomyces sp. NPDC001415]